MSLSVGQWVGEETSLEEMPIIYDAVAQSEVVRVLRISTANLVTVSNQDRKFISKAMWPKLKFIRDRVKQLHGIREDLADQT